jgi:hypothetical protein
MRNSVEVRSIFTFLTVTSIFSNYKIADEDLPGFPPLLRSAQDRFDSRNQFPGGERFGHVVVSPQFESEHLFGLLRPGGQHDDRDAGVPVIGFEILAYLEAVRIGQHEVENDEVGGFGVEKAVERVDLRKTFDFEPRVSEIERHKLQNIRLVINDGDQFAHESSLA